MKNISNIVNKLRTIKKSELSFKHCACLFIGHTIIKTGINIESDKVKIKGSKYIIPCMHAEMSLFNNYIGDRKVNLLVIRIMANGELSNSMPCVMCVELIKKFNINKIYYSTETGIKKFDYTISHIPKSIRVFKIKTNIKYV